ncbi:MAG TPA: class I SAM-dependent methyltransferase [Ilumatobacteraceae bacterium]|nr:class I SAM-dependent methyltransferase [Ilumatobacteraceae bacterium]
MDSTQGPTPDEVDAGHAFYTRRSLAIYDLAILWYFSRLAWKCPASRVLRHYDEHVSDNHLDIGVGTGYFLDRCTFATSSPRIALMDPNEACLDAASRRIERYEPERYRESVLEPFDLGGRSFDSVGMNYLLHCLPGDIRSKAVVFEHVKAVTEPGSVVFGATLLHDGVDRNWMARTVMKRNNRHGIFSNADDDLDGLEWALSQHLAETKIEIVGCVALFAGRT